jgi:hypothetical protein
MKNYRKIWGRIQNIRMGKNFSNKTWKEQETGKSRKLDRVELKSFCKAKETISRETIYRMEENIFKLTKD